MKKYLFVAVLALASVMAYAQPRAIGANLGSNLGFSYQHGFGDANMLDVAVYVPWSSGYYNIMGVKGVNWGLGGIVTYDWIDPFNAPVPWNEKGEWHWYMGVGGAGGVIFPKNGIGAGGWVGAAGHIGIEYDFWFPLQLSLDWRPVLGVAMGDNGMGGTNVDFNKGGLYDGITIGIRYKF